MSRRGGSCVNSGLGGPFGSLDLTGVAPGRGGELCVYHGAWWHVGFDELLRRATERVVCFVEPVSALRIA